MASLEKGVTKMMERKWVLAWALVLATGATVHTAAVAAQGAPAARTQTASTTPISDQELATMQDQLLKLLRTSPKLTTVVARDPSLLADQEYVNRNNPELAQFLSQHPEIARNPDYFLFTHLESTGGRREQALERAVWPEYTAPRQNNWMDIVGPISGAAAFACFLAAMVWIIRLFMENRRWSRIFKLQSEVHGRLIEKFNSPQEIAAYMETEAGKRFLEAAPIPVSFGPEQRMPNAVSRVLWPLQIGIVLVLLGVGLLFVRHAAPESEIPMLVLGTLVLMPGIGFIISAGITWILAGRLGLLPENGSAPSSAIERGHHQDGL